MQRNKLVISGLLISSLVLSACTSANDSKTPNVLFILVDDLGWNDLGFQINKGGHHKGSPPGGYYSPYNNPKLSDGSDGEYLPDRLTNETIRFIEENQALDVKQPFFAYLSFYTVHMPIQACKRHLAKFEEKAKLLDPPITGDFLPEQDGFTKQQKNVFLPIPNFDK